MLVELGLVEQRHAAVKDVLDNGALTDVARRDGVSRSAVHEWLTKYAKQCSVVGRLIELGAYHVEIGQGPESDDGTVLADPEGNEFCVGVRYEFFANTGFLGALAFEPAHSCDRLLLGAGDRVARRL